MSDNREQPAGGVESERLERMLSDMGSLPPYAVEMMFARTLASIITELLAYRRRPPADAGKADSGEAKFWLETREPRQVPRKFGPFSPSRLAETLREFFVAKPAAYITVVTWNEAGGPDFQDGPEALQMADGRSMTTGRRHIASSGAAHAPTPPVPVSEDAVETRNVLLKRLKHCFEKPMRNIETFPEICRDAFDFIVAPPHMARGDQGAGAVPLTIIYTNWRGETAERTITPVRLWYGSTEWHPEPQWLLKAIDAEKGAERDFAWAGIDFQGNGSALIATPTDQVTALVEAARALADQAVHVTLGLAVRKVDLSAAAEELRLRANATLAALLPFAKASAPDDTKGGK